jgi:uncharacterized protein (TIGR02147 family)
MDSIFEYTDYREYLRDYFLKRKKIDSKFSHRWLARKLDLSTSNFILLVMQGKRNLNPSLCLKIADVFKLSKKECEYFENMVNFSQAVTNKEKDLFFIRMATLRKNISIDKIEERQYEYYSSWYNVVIRELLTDPQFGSDPNRLAKQLVPSVSVKQVRHTIDLLLNLGLIEKRGERYVQRSPLISTGPEVNSIAVVNFHKAMGQLAIEALDRIPKKDRNVTSSTFCMTDEVFETVKKKIDDFRRELLALETPNTAGSRVYQLNLQLFPVSKNNSSRGGAND